MNPTEIFDRKVYDVLVAELGAADTAEVLSAFLADTADKFRRLSGPALDRMTTKREAHSIKSSAATFGFFELSRKARQLEADAMQIGLDELRRAIDELQESFLLVRRLAEAILPVKIEEQVR